MRTLCLAFVVLLLSAPVAEARRIETFHYSYDRVWTSAVRLMRLDYNSPITEKDKEDGYFLFDFPHQGKSYGGSFEVSRVKENGRDAVRVSIQIGQMPEYMELMVLDRLEKKLKQDFGPPRISKPAPRDKVEEEAPEAPEDGKAKPDGDAKPKR